MSQNPLKTAEDLNSELDRLLDLKTELQRKLIVEERRVDVLMRVLGYKVHPFHAILLQMKRYLPGPWRLFLAPRGFGKSTTVTVAECVALPLWDTEARVLIGSRAKEQAADILEEVRGCYENERFIDLFGDLRGDKWGTGAATLKTRKKKYKEPTFLAAGADGPVTSKHFTHIKADDLVDERNARTEGERERIYTFFFKTLVPTLIIRRDDGTPGEIDLIGTCYHPDDLYARVLDNPKFEGNICRIPALVDPETGEASTKPGAVSVCPEIAPSEDLHEMRSSMGSAHFDSQMQQSTERMKGDIFEDRFFKHYDEDPHKLVKRLELKVWAAQDLAVGEKDENCEYADAVIGVDDRDPRDLGIYLLDRFHEVIPYGQQIARVAYIFDTWDPIRLGIEANALQKHRIDSTYRDVEFLDLLSQMGIDEASLKGRIVPIITLKDKTTRAWKLAARYESGQIYHRKDVHQDVEDHLVGIPKAKLNDLFDAIDLAVTLGCVVRAKKKRKRRSFGIRRKTSRVRIGGNG